MSFKPISNAKAILRESLARIDSQLLKKGLYNQLLDSKTNYLTLQSDDDKHPTVKSMASNMSSTYASQRTAATVASIDIINRKKINKEPEPYFSTIKTDFQNSVQTVTEDKNETKKSTYDSKVNQTNRENLFPIVSGVENDSNNKNYQQSQIYSSSIYQQIEEKIMNQVEIQLKNMKNDYKEKINQLFSQSQSQSVNNKDINTQAKEYIDSKAELFKNTLQFNMTEVHAKIDQLSKQISNKTSSSSSNQIAKTVLSLSEQAVAIQTQITLMKENASLFATNLNTISEQLNNNTRSLSNHQSQFNKIQKEIKSIKSFFDQYKQEQVKLNDMHEKTLSTLVTHFLSLQEDTKTVLDDHDRIEDNFETSQNNFEQLHSVIEKFPKMNKDLSIVTEIIKSMTQDYKEIKGEVNSNFSSLSKWQAELIDNVTKAVNELKQDYNEKFRKNTAIIGIHSERNEEKEKDKDNNKEIMNKIDSMQAVNEQKYVSKNEYDYLKARMSDIENIIKDNASK